MVTMAAMKPNHEEVAPSDERRKRKRSKKLLSDIRQQVEFYFSEANLRKDRFLKKEIDRTEERYIDIGTISGFNRMRALTTDQALIARALEKSVIVEVNPDKTAIRRVTPLSEPKYDIDVLTVYVENLPRNVDHDMVKKVFGVCGEVAYVSLPRYKMTNDPKGFAFVEFTNPDEARKACKLLNNPPCDKPTNLGHFPTTRRGRLILPDGPIKKEPNVGSQNPERKPASKRKRETIQEDMSNTTGEEESKRSVQKKAEEDLKRLDKQEKTSKKRKTNMAGLEECSPKDGRRNGTEQSSKRQKVAASTDAAARSDGSNGRTKKPSKRKLDDSKDDSQSETAKTRKDVGDREECSSRTVAKGGNGQGVATKDGVREQTKASRKRRHSGREEEGVIPGRSDVISAAKSSGTRSDSCRKTTRSQVPSKSSVQGKKSRKGTGDEEAAEPRRAKLRRLEGSEDEDMKKKRRSRNKKHPKEDGEMKLLTHLRVLPKKEWLALKEEYLALQKASRQQAKQMWKVQQSTSHQCKKTHSGANEDKAEIPPKSTEPEFSPGLVLRISCDKPFVSRKVFREQLDKLLAVAYVDMNDGDNAGHVRLKTTEGARKMLDSANQLTNDGASIDMACLSGEAEQGYWLKLKSDRESKLKKTRGKKKRGVDRIQCKSEKVASLPKRQLNKHIVFDDE